MNGNLSPQSGFTLVELAIVLVVVALLVGGLLVPLTMQIEQQKIREMQKAMEEIKEALVGYALAHSSTPNNRPYLPCPDTSGTGVEDARVSGACPSQEGRVPWSTLGVAKTDSWGNRFRYRVTPAFSNSSGFSLTSPGTLRICEQQACTSTLATGIPAVIVSHGKNGYGAWTNDGTVIALPATLPNPGDEMENINGRNNPTPGNSNPDTADTANNDFVSRAMTGEFDDLVTWLSPNILFNRMVAGGRLP